MGILNAAIDGDYDEVDELTVEELPPKLKAVVGDLQWQRNNLFKNPTSIIQ